MLPKTYRNLVSQALRISVWQRDRAIAICLLIVVWTCASAVNAFAGGLVSVSDGEQTYLGKVVALNKQKCSLMDRQGQLVHLDVPSLKSFEKIGARYQPLAASQLRHELRKEFPDGYEFSGTTHYLVCGPVGRSARYAELFEDIYRDVEQFYRVRGFNVVAPEVPLIAVVFQTQKEFVEYCIRDQVAPSPGLMGYYSLKTNRVALFDDARLLSGEVQAPKELLKHDELVSASAGISSTTANTVIHETTHQVGYNIGIHSRLAETPIWLVEGLATVLEPAGMRNSSGRKLLSQRINEERVNWFTKQHRPKRSMGNLAKIVASDQFFYRYTLNGYSEAWAFTFFLFENPSRRKDLVTYLQIIGARDPMVAYPAKQRLQDFQKAFGDISRLEVEFIRYMDRM